MMKAILSGFLTLGSGIVAPAQHCASSDDAAVVATVAHTAATRMSREAAGGSWEGAAQRRPTHIPRLFAELSEMGPTLGIRMREWNYAHM